MASKEEPIQPSVPTRQGSRHNEASRANENQYNFNIGIRHILSKEGVDKELLQKKMKAHWNILMVIFSSRRIGTSSSSMRVAFRICKSTYAVFCQHLDVCIHKELI